MRWWVLTDAREQTNIFEVTHLCARKYSQVLENVIDKNAPQTNECDSCDSSIFCFGFCSFIRNILLWLSWVELSWVCELQPVNDTNDTYVLKWHVFDSVLIEVFLRFFFLLLFVGSLFDFFSTLFALAKWVLYCFSLCSEKRKKVFLYANWWTDSTYFGKTQANTSALYNFIVRIQCRTMWRRNEYTKYKCIWHLYSARGKY